MFAQVVTKHCMCCGTELAMAAAPPAVKLATILTSARLMEPSRWIPRDAVMPQAQRNGTGTHPPARNRLEATVVYKICGFGPPAILPPLCRAQLAPRRFKAARARCQLLQHGRRPAIPLSGEFCAAADATPSCWLFFLPDFPLLLPFFP
jgi:hypothetical protein